MKRLLLIVILLFLTLSACDPSETPRPPGDSNDVTPPNDSVDPTPVDITFTLLEGQDTVEIHTTWIDAGAMFTVNGEESTIMGSNINTSQLGLHTVTYEATHDGEPHRLRRYVMVTDQTPPVITLNPGIDTIQLGGTWEDAGATVTDNSGETLTIEVSGEVNTNVVGTYIITYDTTDSSGNTARVQRHVNVVE